MAGMKRAHVQQHGPTQAELLHDRSRWHDEPADVPPEASHGTAKLLLRPMEVAGALGVGRSTVYELMRTGELPIIHIGRSVRIPLRALEAWVERQADSSHAI
jgi:excisionase family DNA binding protein